MNSYIKVVFFAVVFALIAWDIGSGFAPQGPITINKAGSSASFIQQESNLNVPISTPKTSIATSVTQRPLNNKAGIRDYVNPQLNPAGQPKPQQSNPQTQNLNPTSTTTTTTIKPSNTQNRGGVRDYVNPNFGVQNQRQQMPTTPNPVANSNSRDYVAPPRPPRPEFPSLPSPRPNQKNPTPNLQGPTSSQHIPQNPAPNFQGPTRSQQSPQNPTPNFPALPGRPPANPQLPATTPISYANKVAGGVTTKSPLSTTKASSGLPSNPSGSTTEKPDEGPSDAELREFSEALLRRDVNNAAKYVSVNLQGKTTSQSQNDEAPQKLLEVKPEAFQIPTISKLKLLHNNYILETNENEHVTAQEKAEENDLLEAMLTTPIMQFTKNFLIANGKISKDPKDFKNLLKVLWFNMYSRGGGRIGSSGFEHIFLAELKNNEVSGLHNWVYFDQAELSKIVDYLGYMKKIDLGEKGSILKFHFKLNGVDKPVDSMFIGTSPELEVALYTTCYLFRADKICPLKLNGNNFIIRTYNFRYRGKNMIGSAFPEI